MKMISYERTGFGKFIDPSCKGIKCMICGYSYFSDGFKYQSYVCNECHDFSMTVMNLSDFFILKGIDYRVYITNVDKKRNGVNILNNSKLGNKGVL